jgi:DNA (cytosine-5)-methyltransferase 1
MNHGSLFSGIGGFDLAAQWMGWNNKFHCELNEFGQRVLKYYWPNAESFTDITKTDFTKYANSIDILTGGFPCQPYSSAGKRLGTEDERHLWPEMLRAIREISPRWVVGENVFGLINWNGGVVFDEVQADLEAEGYEVTPFLLPACGVNAPHRRFRIWFVAYRNSNDAGRCRYGKTGSQESKSKIIREERERVWGIPERTDEERSASNTDNTGTNNDSGTDENREKKNKRRRGQPQFEPGQDGSNGLNSFPQRIGQQEPGGYIETLHSETFGKGEASWSYNVGRWPTQSSLCYGNDGLSGKLDRITFSDWRQESIKGGGNAIVPQVVLQIFKAIEEYEKKD